MTLPEPVDLLSAQKIDLRVPHPALVADASLALGQPPDRIFALEVG